MGPFFRGKGRFRSSGGDLGQAWGPPEEGGVFAQAAGILGKNLGIFSATGGFLLKRREYWARFAGFFSGGAILAGRGQLAEAGPGSPKALLGFPARPLRGKN
jgi:hypothetical protein